MDPLSTALLLLGLAVAVLLGVAVARRSGIPEPIVLVAVGLVVSAAPGAAHLQLAPDLVFLLFLPPLVYRASFLTDPSTLRQHASAIALLAVGLVVTTAVLVALALTALVPGLSLAEGLVLGAIVAPTDPVAASAVFRRLGAPRRVVDLVEAESLVNDATALVLYGLALQAVVTRPPSAWEAAGQLLLSVAGGLAVGLAVGALALLLRKRIADVGLQLMLSLVTPYAAYLPAARVGASGVLAVVAAGVLVGARSGSFAAQVRLQSSAFWSLLDLLLNAVLFVLLGLQIRGVVVDTPHLGVGELALDAAAVLLVVLVVRVAWQFVVPPVLYRLRTAAGRPQRRSSGSERLLIGWSGMRGAISLAAALGLPLTTDRGPFPQRGLLLFLTVTVVLGTLLLQGLTLPFLLRHPRLAGDGRPEAEQERLTRIELAELALARLDDLERSGQVPPGGAAPLRELWEHARVGLLRDDEAAQQGLARPATDLVAVRLDITQAQTELLEQRRRSGDAPPEVVRELQQELDLQRVRLE